MRSEVLPDSLFLASTSPVTGPSSRCRGVGQKTPAKAHSALQDCPIDPYIFALAAMPLLDDRIKFSSFTTTTGQPIESLREWLRAVEVGEWPA